jgi:WD40 repeat protein
MSKVQVTRLHSLSGHRDAIYTLQASSIDSKFFSGAGDGMVVVWDLNAPEQGELIAKLPNSVYALYHLGDSEILVAGQNFEGIHLLDWRNKKEIGSLQVTKAAIFDIQQFNERLIIAAGDGSVTAVDHRSLTVAARAQRSEKNARTIAVNPENGDVAIGYSDSFIRIFDENLNQKHEWLAHGNSVFTLRYSPDYRTLLSGSRDARLKVWDASNGYPQVEEVVAHMYAINHLEFSPDGKHFVTCSMDKSIKVWDLAQMKLLKVIDRARHAGHGTSVNKLLWTRFNNQLVSASDDRTISVWQVIF